MTKLHRAAPWALLAPLLLPLTGQPSAQDAVEPSLPTALVAPGELVSAQRGSLPIVISAPHGGGVRVPGSAGREGGVQVRDLRTAELAWLVAQDLAAALAAFARAWLPAAGTE